MKRMFSGICMGVMISLVGGCLSGASREYGFAISVSNASDADILSVVIDREGIGNHFGFIAAKGAGKTAGGCRFRFAKAIAIEWEEGGTTRTSVVDLMPYAGKRGEIRNFTFRYLGNDRWEVIALAGIDDDSPVVAP